MKTTVFMPIKLNNERIPGKNLKCLDDGIPLLQVPLKTALEAKADGDVDRIVVFCSKEEVKEYIVKLFRLIHSLNPDYKLYIRQYGYNDNETIVYAV